ncbi:hypothetical protein [Shewanella sp. MMG014]|uniref:hypothetical protein n=1 Tax=Shewanella sp. MMG014 TaxID=2822691 RepID=UPI001FFC7FBA|nr:hypothetical protein [Shewanella sp. MMG014]
MNKLLILRAVTGIYDTFSLCKSPHFNTSQLNLLATANRLIAACFNSKSSANAKIKTASIIICYLFNGIVFSVHATDEHLDSTRHLQTISPLKTALHLETYLGGHSTNLANKAALSFKFGQRNSQHVCHITTTEEHLMQSKNLLENINLSEKYFFFDCQIDNDFYVLSNQYRTYAQVIIKQPDINFPMSMHIEAKLVTIDGKLLNVTSGDISLKWK